MINGGTLSIRAENVNADRDILDEFGLPISGRFVCISVSDNGVGMSKDIQKHIFEPFYTTKPAGKGSGLGLSMVYGFIQQTKGYIKVYSQEGTGTTIQLFVPISGNIRENTEFLHSAPKDVMSHLPKDFTVLVIEDDDYVRMVATDLLIIKGITTLSAASPEEAISIAKRIERLDLIFTDIVLSSDKNGVELAREIKALHSSAKVLFTTGYAQQEILSDISLYADSNVLRKPYNAKSLYESIDEIVKASV
jgi:CheY-like chemotaxis protein